MPITEEMIMEEPIRALEPRISILTLLVEDLQRAYDFYHHGLGFPTTRKPDQGWLGFQTQGICLCLYPYDHIEKENLPRKADRARALDRTIYPPISLAYNTREKHEVQQVLDLAQQAGGTIEKMPEDTFWGGFSGYFSDPDGHLWEVAWAQMWKFHPDGSLIID